MKKILISFANEKYYPSLDLLQKTALEVGKIDGFKGYTQEGLKKSHFWAANAYILTQQRGAGFWAWKPYILLETFKEIDEDDIVMYSDAGIKVIDDLSPLFKIAQEKGRIVFKIPGDHLNKTFTKGDCFGMMMCNEPKYWNSVMINGAVSLWKKTEENQKILEEWLNWCKKPLVITDTPTIFTPNQLEFRDHRHDQSILSIMSVKYNWERFRDPTQWGTPGKNRFENSPYGELMYHHRGKI